MLVVRGVVAMGELMEGGHNHSSNGNGGGVMGVMVVVMGIWLMDGLRGWIG